MITSIAFTFIGDIVIVANITVFAIVITFAAVNLAVIVLRYTEPDIERKFRVPVNIGKFPVLPLFGVGISVYMAFQFEIEVILVGVGIIGVGVIFYFLYGKRNKITS
jgi:APA family basic amino acid/polyamine antiporter